MGRTLYTICFVRVSLNKNVSYHRSFSRPGHPWTHEDASEMMFDDLIEKNGIQIDRDDVNFIKDLIKGVPQHSLHK